MSLNQTISNEAVGQRRPCRLGIEVVSRLALCRAETVPIVSIVVLIRIGTLSSRRAAAAASHAALETRWWVEVAARVSIAVTSDEVHADGDAVVAANVDVRWRVRKTTFVRFTATPATQELTTDLNCV